MLSLATKSLARRGVRRESAACFYAIRFAARTAKSIGPGRSSRIGVSRAVAWFSDRCSISGRSTTAGGWRGAERSRFSTKAEGGDRSRCFPKIVPPGSRLRRGFDPAERDAVAPPTSMGACWLAMVLWDQLRLDDCWRPALPPSREGTVWLNVLKTLVAYRLISPGSEWRLHRHWFERSAMGDLLGEDAGLAQPNNLYRCLDLLVAHKPALFTLLRERWQDLFRPTSKCCCMIGPAPISNAIRRKTASGSSATDDRAPLCRRAFKLLAAKLMGSAAGIWEAGFSCPYRKPCISRSRHR